MDSLDEAVDYAKAQFPPELWNTVTTALMVYHNTLLKEIEDDYR